MIFIPNYVQIKYNDINITNNIYILVVLFSLCGYFIGAFLADKFDIKIVYSLSTLVCIIVALPIYQSLQYGNFDYFYILISLLSISQASAGVLSLLQLAKRFPMENRYLLTSLCNALSSFLFLGMPPFLFSFLMQQSGVYYPMLIFIFVLMVQIYSTQIFYNKT